VSVLGPETTRIVDELVARRRAVADVFPTKKRAVVGRLDALATDVGRLRRLTTDSSSYSALLTSRIADHVETLDSMVSFTAHAIYRANRAAGIEDKLAIEQALAAVDDRACRLRKLLGEKDSARAA
jgi:hypothetical protein